ncbi:MAG: inositol monophosphatase [Acidobacteria bacterium]|nr:inositol monophosphatase [Acidobacteriota bacterium]
MSFEKELHVAQLAARRAAANALRIQSGAGFHAESKADLSPVTQADKEGETIIAGLLNEVFPEDGILGEEGSASESRSGRKWIIDPIDGTRDFVRGNHLWCVLIGLEGEDRETKAGVAYFPILDQMWIAARGLGAYRNHTRIHCSNKTSASDSVLMVNIGNKIAHRADSAKWVEFLGKFWAFRSLGGAQDAMMVSAGQADLWIEPKAEPWDFAAIQVISEEAGATYTTLKGTRSIYDGSAVVYAPGLEPEVSAFLASVRV